MAFIILRIGLFAIFLSAGYLLGGKYDSQIIGAAWGAAIGAFALLTEAVSKKISLGIVIGGVFGMSMGLVLANLLLFPLKAVISRDFVTIAFVVNALFVYTGLLVGLKRGKGLTISGILRLFKGQGVEENLKLLDTSVIIDGRIADVCEAGFIEGIFILPQFILQELQYIADSPDSLKRARGRRGLDVLHKLQKMSNVTVRIVDEDFPKIREVDAKLVALARVIDAKVITNDFNLNKVAELQGVAVLNIHELANALKPVVLPGETIKVFVIKEGKEHNQGVAYLDDGTMVVVENARKLIGKNVDVTVTSVLQTTAGRMIFSKTKEEYDREN
ncbi:MAG: TRAM domain-containing protein [Thermodesulfovibrionales bacterium]|nr:TRAM domain-containing protein [Thermodesulfovibrionales bacterium]